MMSIVLNGATGITAPDIDVTAQTTVAAFDAGITLGGSTTTLDDYEEGTWTPTTTASGNGAVTPTAVTAYGTYTKTGNSVVARFTMIATSGSWSWSALNSYFSLYGLPFTANNDYNSFVMSTGNIASTGAKGVGRVVASQSYALYWGLESVGGTVTQLSGTITYQTNA